MNNDEKKVKSLLKKEDIKYIEMEIGDTSSLGRYIGNGPTVLTLTNDCHRGVANMEDIHALDMQNIIALRLPGGPRGLLRHNGYSFIAYALYWGIPISFADEY
jgi:hypothetical protein